MLGESLEPHILWRRILKESTKSLSKLFESGGIVSLFHCNVWSFTFARLLTSVCSITTELPG